MSINNNNILDSLNTNTNNKTVNTININMDELSQLINRLSELFKKYINQLKTYISQNREIYSFIDKRVIYVQKIINNIVNHNYTFEQLKSLEDTVNQIKENNNAYKTNIFNDEQNLIIFIEETNVLFKSIKQKYKIKLEEWSNYISISGSTKSKNNSININTDNNMCNFKDKNNIGKNYIKIYDNNLYDSNICEKKRTKSTENKNKVLNNENYNSIRNRNMCICKSQRMINEKNSSNKRRSSRNNSKIDDKRLNLFNLNIPTNNKYHSIYNIDIRNEVLLNRYDKNDTKNNVNEMNRNSFRYFNNKNDEVIRNYEKIIDDLKKENSKYKTLINLLNKNKNVLNDNNNNILMDALKQKENEIISKDKRIKSLYREMNKYKYYIDYINKVGKSKSDINSSNEGNNNYLIDLNQKFKTESNISKNIAFNSNKKNNINDKKIKNNQFVSGYLTDKTDNENEEYFKKRIQLLEKENNIIKSKLNKTYYELIPKSKRLEKENLLLKKEIMDLKKQLKKEINAKEELSKTYNDQRIQYEYELSKINEKTSELTKFLSNKHSEITNLQQEILSKDKELENYKLLLNKKESKINKDENEKIKQYYTKIIKEKEIKEIELNSEINVLNKKNDILFQQNEKKKKEISKLNINIKELEEELIKKKEELKNTNQIMKDNNNYNKNHLKEEIKEYEIALNKLTDENEALKEFTQKQQKILLDNEKKEEKINALQKEKEALKQYFIDMEIPLQITQNNDSIPKSNKMKKEKNKTFQSKFTEEECFNILLQLNEAKKEIASLKKKNEQLINDLDCKRLKNDCFENISAEKPLSNYEEEFDLKKMVKGSKDKNRSQDINIDYPGIQLLKEKYRELDFYYNSLEDLVKKMLLSSTCTNKNKTYIVELCKIVGFNEEIIYEIVNNKNKKGIKNLFK